MVFQARLFSCTLLVNKLILFYKINTNGITEQQLCSTRLLFCFLLHTNVEYGEMCMSKLLLKNITKSTLGILRQYAIFISSSRKKVLVLAGPSRCGKTITSELVAGFLTPDSGEIYIDDQLVNQKTPAQRSISWYFRKLHCFLI